MELDRRTGHRAYRGDAHAPVGSDEDESIGDETVRRRIHIHAPVTRFDPHDRETVGAARFVSAASI